MFIPYILGLRPCTLPNDIRTMNNNTFKDMLRKLLGIESQALQIAQLHRDLAKLQTDLDQTQMRAGTTTARHDLLRTEVEELGVMATRTQESLGGAFWTTASGYMRPIALLSDTHLQALLDGNFAKGMVLQAVLAEKARRVEDDEWADKQGPGSLRNRVKRLENISVAPPRKVDVSGQTRRHDDAIFDVDMEDLELRTIMRMLLTPFKRSD